MLLKPLTVLIALSLAAYSLPLQKRIAQVIADSTTKWESACLAAGGGEKCNPLSVAAFSTLLIAAGPCDQQNAADNMIDLAHQLNSDADMITLTQIFNQQPRNSPNSVSVPYCQQAPRNKELDGLFQCQFDGVNPTVFVGNVAVGAAGTIPFGRTSPVNPPRSCPAHTSGGIADGTQLTDIVSDPGVGSSSNNDNSEGSTTGDESSASLSPVPSKTEVQSTSSPTSTPESSATASSSSSSTSSSFALQNGIDAQELNAKFAELSSTSSCSAGDVACVNGSFAQCVNGAFVLTPCNTAAGLTCAALPLVNSPGTSVTCTTEADAVARIARTGAQGGLTGNN